jgi:hypothetical protein
MFPFDSTHLRKKCGKSIVFVSELLKKVGQPELEPGTSGLGGAAFLIIRYHPAAMSKMIKRL